MTLVIEGLSESAAEQLPSEEDIGCQLQTLMTAGISPSEVVPHPHLSQGLLGLLNITAWQLPMQHDVPADIAAYVLVSTSTDIIGRVGMVENAELQMLDATFGLIVCITS